MLNVNVFTLNTKDLILKVLNINYKDQPQMKMFWYYWKWYKRMNNVEKQH